MPDPGQTAHVRRSRRGIVATCLTVIVAVVVVACSSGNGGTGSTVHGRASSSPRASDSSSTPSTPSAASSSSTSVAGSRSCNQPASSQKPPTIAPASAWELVGKMAAPTDRDGAGPGRIARGTGLRTCFAHDPVGALYAAVNWIAMLTDPELAGPAAAADGITAPGPGRDAIRVKLANASAADFAGSDGVQVVGFRFRAYTGDVALVDVVIGAVGLTGMADFPMSMEWSGEDWLLELPADGNLPNSSQHVDSLAGYTPWSVS